MKTLSPWLPDQKSLLTVAIKLVYAILGMMQAPVRCVVRAVLMLRFILTALRFIALFALASPDSLLAQGTFSAGFTVLRTGGGQPLTTELRAGQVDANVANPYLQFSFGFATDAFDLYDHQNAPGSLAWLGDITVVPEPQAWLLGGMGLAILIVWGRCRR